MPELPEVEALRRALDEPVRAFPIERAGVWLLTPEQADEELAHLGPEALGLGAERLAEILAAGSAGRPAGGSASCSRPRTAGTS